MKKLGGFLFLLGPWLGFDARAWFCTEGASRRVGGIYEVCGVASESSEAAARKAALENALQEFHVLCDPSDDCRGRRVSVEPKRTECRLVNDRTECRRMIQVTLGSPGSEREPSAVPVEKSRFRIEIGEPVSEAMRILGEPDQIIDADDRRGIRIYHYFNRPVCAFQSCSLVVRNGVVERQSGLKGELIASPQTEKSWSFWKIFF